MLVAHALNLNGGDQIVGFSWSNFKDGAPILSMYIVSITYSLTRSPVVCLSIACRLLVDNLSFACQSPVVCLSIACRLLVDRLSFACRLPIDMVSVALIKWNQMAVTGRMDRSFNLISCLFLK